MIRADSSFQDITPALAVVILIGCVLAALAQGIKAVRGEASTGGATGGALAIMLFGGLVATGLSVLPRILNKETGNENSEAKPDPSPTPPPLPETTTPADTGTPLKALLWIGVAIAAIALIAAIIWSISQLRQRQLRQRQQRQRKHLEAQKAQRKALEEAQAKIAERWKTVTDRHEAMRRNVLKAETDWDMLFDLPALTDIKIKATSKLYRAMRDAENAIPDMPATFTLSTDLNTLAYPKAVRAFEDSWEAAYANAQRISTTKIPAKELKTIQRIRALLTLAEGIGATDHERHTAYTQIRKMLGDLKTIKVPERALLHIEEKQRLALAV